MDGIVFAGMVVGLAALVWGAEMLVRGAARLAGRIGVSPLVVGLTVVAFGTSAPEMFVSVHSAWSGPAGAGIAVGNVVGSNIFNVLLILGVSALAAPLVVSDRLIRVDVPLMILASALVPVLAWGGSLSRWSGVLLLCGIALYTGFAIRLGRTGAPALREEIESGGGAVEPSRWGWGVDVALVGFGLGLLAVGARWLVTGAVALAEAVGVSSLVVGLTVVAGGTSLPELATSVVAALRGQREIAVGNVVGSNLFNLLAVLGMAAVVAPSGLEVAPSALRFDIPIMIAAAVACLPIFFTGHTIARWEGGVFVGYYVAYVSFLVLAGTRHEALAGFSTAMMAFVVPVTVITVGISVAREVRGRRRTAAAGPDHEGEG